MASDPVELTKDPEFARRVIRLAVTSSIALGVIWLLAIATLDAHPAVELSLGLGWLLMPLILFVSLQWPRLRYALAIPSVLVAAPLLIISGSDLPADQVARSGWILLTVGILIGGVLGVWFWFRWFPVPASLHTPFSPPRWALIGVHVALIVLGVILVTASNLLKRV